MKVLSVLGSPRKNGYTSALLESYTAGLKENNERVEIKEVYLENLTIKGCKGCIACQSKKVDLCISDDDMTDIYKDVMESDVIIMASPIYFFSVTAQMKTMMDRLFAIYGDLRNKKIVFLSTYGAETIEESGVENAIKMFEMTGALTGIELVQQFHVSTANETGIKMTNKIALNEAYDLAKTLEMT